jgi:hypothetical protein
VTVTWEGVAVTVVVLGTPVIHATERAKHQHSQAGDPPGKVSVLAGVLVASRIYYIS